MTQRTMWYTAVGGTLLVMLLCCCGAYAFDDDGARDPMERVTPGATFDVTQPSATPTVTPSPTRTPKPRKTTKPREETEKPERDRLVRSCADADGPIFRGEPGYSRRLDRDGDGVACE